ncbi:MAG: sigma-54-dependent Fis family transcriptional regulator [Candidatus Delongbacteria bacterium]|nr:sigma-54-dependent Fis family transcriptional regulator [Candidatus Delongbacteria bacterium]
MRVLIVDDEVHICEVISELLEQENYETATAGNGVEALQVLEQGKFDVVISDVRMPEMDGIELLREIRARYPQIKVLLFTGYASVDSVVEAMKIGAYGYLTKPIDRDELFNELALIREQNEILKDGHQMQSEMFQRYAQGEYQVRSKSMQSLYELTITRIARSDSTVLIEGESGTGKELMAGMIHHFSNRSKRELIKINCAALAEGLLESELFGHVKGAFTGAVADRKGRFELADGGALFLDEVGEMSPALQVKLLRVLQEGEFERVGSSETVKVDVRLIAATNLNLKEEVARGNFRTDLYYRLNVINIPIPPLRDRREDIPQLVVHFIDKFRSRLGKPKMYLRRGAYEAIVRHNWPGNIRELENCIERACVMAAGDTIELTDLPPEVQQHKITTGTLTTATVEADSVTAVSSDNVSGSDITTLEEQPDIAPLSLTEAREQFEKNFLVRKLAEKDGNVSHTAQDLKIARKNLQQKIKKYQINVEQYRKGEK